MKSCNEETNKGSYLEVEVQYPEKLLDLHNNSSFVHEDIKIEKVENLVANLYDEIEYLIHINLKQPFNLGLVFTKLHRIIKF